MAEILKIKINGVVYQLTSERVADGSVTEAKIAAHAVTTRKIALKSVASSQIDDMAIKEAHINPSAVTSEKIKNGAVSNEKLAEEVTDEITAARSTAETAQSTADQAQETAEYAIGIARTVEVTADQAMSIAKGANQAETFDTVAQMNKWIGERKNEVEVDSVTGMTLPAGSTVIFSADPVNGANTDGYGGAIAINGTYREGFAPYVMHGRFFTFVVLDTDTTIDSVEEGVSWYDDEIIEVGDNARWSWTSEKITPDKLQEDGIDYDLIKSHNIKLGTNLYIRDTDVPDYWWDGVKPQELETQKVDLTDLENGLQSILDAVDSILEGGAS